ncbi:ADP-ribosylation factor [Plasmodium brasilianum]|uniref:ADP-ribosylation factor, putative n=2 Tax=Plasmodium (Plasmodium) TaxID=418103 RepID=A0A1A8WBQ4_PLAMA|nr:ADP-ribosylation factor [Plasmodium brasilianum]SBS90291.1 ADP-ribosylation factor, putative [Plasmodium malariae]
MLKISARVKTLFINEESLSIKIKKDKNSFEEKNYEITFFEVGKNCSYNLIKEYSSISDDVIYIVDSVHKSTLNEARDEFIRIVYDFQFIYRKCKFLIFLNKQDSKGCLRSEEIINYFALPKELLYRCKFVRCSTLSGEGLTEGLEWLLNSNVFVELNDFTDRNRRPYRY